jgi:hypothetical protein
MECQHVFVTKEKKKFASCLGTHCTRCFHCDKNYFKHISDVQNDGFKENAARIERTMSELTLNEKVNMTMRHYYTNTAIADNICVYDGDLYPKEKKCINNHKCPQ